MDGDQSTVRKYCPQVQLRSELANGKQQTVNGECTGVSVGHFWNSVDSSLEGGGGSIPIGNLLLRDVYPVGDEGLGVADRGT